MWETKYRHRSCRYTTRWDKINFEQGYANIFGHEGGRKHPRDVWLAPWIMLQLIIIRAKQFPPSTHV